MIKHTLCWVWEKYRGGGDDTMSFEKEIHLPFLLSKDVELRVLSCWPVMVHRVEIDIDNDGTHEVFAYLKDWACDANWEEVLELFEKGGWRLMDHEGTASEYLKKVRTESN